MFHKISFPTSSDGRAHAPPPRQLGRWFFPYIKYDHVTAASFSSTTWSNDLGRPHLICTLDGHHTVRALVDSGSSICIGDSSLIKKLDRKVPVAPPIHVTDCHNHRKPTMGCYRSSITIEDSHCLYPVTNKPIDIHMTPSLSSELILGTDFLSTYGAIMHMASNKIIFMPEELTALGLSQKPIISEAIASMAESCAPDTFPCTFSLQPMNDQVIKHMDQKTFHATVVTDNPSMVFKPGTTIMITSSGYAPYVQIPDALYTVEDKNSIQITLKNNGVQDLILPAARPIPGIVAHDLGSGYFDPVEINKDTLRAMFLKDISVSAAKLAGLMPETASVSASNLAKDSLDYIEPTPQQYIDNVQALFNQACSLLQASGLDPPGSRRKPRQKASLHIKETLMSQFDTSGIDKTWVEDYNNLILENWDVFSLDKYDVGFTPHYEHKIESTTDEPVFVKQFKIAIGDEQALDEMSTHLTAARILIEQPSENNTPIFMVAKRGGQNPGKKRFVQDFRKRNAASKDDKYTIRDVRESLTAVGRLKPNIFSCLDFTGAFYCLGLEKSSQKLTSFTLPFKNAQYSWARMPQGLKGASASFSKLCQIIFKHIPNIITYVDDLLGAATDHLEMIKLLNQVFEECRYHGMKLNLGKCKCGVRNLTWLGYNLNAEGISPEFDKAEAVKSMSLPTTIKEIQSHLGLFQFFSDLIDQYALIAAPLSAVTSPEHRWKSFKLSGDLPDDAQEAWFRLRNIIASRPVIAFPDFSLPFQLFVDASVGRPHEDPPIRGGMGAILTQVQQGVTRPVGYFSRQFRDSESNYNAFNAELCGVVTALDHFMTYLKHANVTIFTDHMPLVKRSAKDENTMNALLYKLSLMDINLVHLKGSEMPSDALSRIAFKDVKMTQIVSSAKILQALPEAMSNLHWKFEQSQDPTCQVMKAYLKNQKISPSPVMESIIKLYAARSFVDKEDGLLYLYTSRDKRLATKRLWVPSRLKPMIISNHHGSSLAGHWKEERTYELIAIKYFWPSMSQDIADHIHLCKICHQQSNRNASKELAPLQPWGPPTSRNQRIHFDLVGPLKSSETDFRYIMTITDAFTRWVELVPIINKEAITVAQALWDTWICTFGFFRQSVSDGGGEFDNEVMKELTKLMRTKHHIISPYQPSVNGVIERVHRSLGSYIRSFCEENTTDWVQFLPTLKFSLNTKIHSSTKMSPYFITFMEHPIFPWTPEENITYSESQISDRIRLLQYAQQLVCDNDYEAKNAMKRAFDVKSKHKQFKIGDQVLLYLPSPPQGQNSKFYTPWRGIYTVVKSTSKSTYEVRKKGGRIRRAHVNRLKFYDPLNSSDDKSILLSLDEDEIEEPKENEKTLNDLHSSQRTAVQNPDRRITRSATRSLPPPINRLSALAVVDNQHWTSPKSTEIPKSWPVKPPFPPTVTKHSMFYQQSQQQPNGQWSVITTTWLPKNETSSTFH